MPDILHNMYRLIEYNGEKEGIGKEGPFTKTVELPKKKELTADDFDLM